MAVERHRCRFTMRVQCSQGARSPDGRNQGPSHTALPPRLVELDARLAAIATEERYRGPVAWLRCFRGIDTLTAMLILAGLHDFRRFGSARALMAFLGLVPGEDSSGEKLDAAGLRRWAMGWSVGSW